MWNADGTTVQWGTKPFPATFSPDRRMCCCICYHTGVWEISWVLYRSEEGKIDPRKRAVKMKELCRGVCKSWMRKDEILIPTSLCQSNYGLKCHDLIKQKDALFQFLACCLSPGESSLSWVSSTSAHFHIYHLQLSRWGDRQEQQDESNKQTTAFIKANTGFQPADLYRHCNDKNSLKHPKSLTESESAH